MEIILRPEQPSDYWDTEYVVKKAFWNLHYPGCNEHYLVHLLRKDAAYLPEISRVAEVDGKVAGVIMYSRAWVCGDAGNREILTFGPLCVEPSLQRRGIGGQLLEETMALARSQGHQAIVIFGEPEYYPRHGFRTCDHFGITTWEGKNMDAFMGIELVAGGLKGIQGRFKESDVFFNLPQEDVDAYDKGFPQIPKMRLPGQWESEPI